VTSGVLAAPRLRRCRLAEYEPYVDHDLLEEIASLGRQVAGLRVLHLSHRDVTADPVAAGLRSLVTLEREAGLESEWLVAGSETDARDATRADDWWPHPSDAQWSAWISSNFRAARDIADAWDVGVVHGPSLAGVAAIAHDKAGRWLWQAPHGGAIHACRRASDFLASYSATVHDDNDAGTTVDPLAPLNVRLPRGIARRIGRILDLDFDRPLLCHIARFAPWLELDEVISAYWEAKQAMPDLQLAIGGAVGGREARGYGAVAARASEDHDLHVLASLSTLEIAALRNCASINLRGPAPTGHTVDVRECVWIGGPLLAWRPQSCAGRPPDPYTLSAATSVRAAGLQIAELLMSDEPSGGAARGHEAIRSNHLILHGLRDWLRTLTSLVATA
jgi:hypothetical protein